MDETIARVLAALYVPGAPVGLSSRRWSEIVCLLRRAGEQEPQTLLLRSGYAAEALRLDQRALAQADRDLCEGLVTGVQFPVTDLWSPGSRPVALWSAGTWESRRMTVAGIGCRRPSESAARFAVEVGAGLAREGYGLVSGGAAGCDAAFALGHGDACAVLPHGLNVPREDLHRYGLLLSGFASDAAFSSARAMARNALVLGAGRLTFVASARLREGGSWHAAIEGIRARRPLAVYVGPGAGAGAQALVRLGGLAVASPEEAIALADLARTIGPGEGLAQRWYAASGHDDERLQRPLAFR